MSTSACSEVDTGLPPTPSSQVVFFVFGDEPGATVVPTDTKAAL